MDGSGQMMGPDEFKRRLDLLLEVIRRGLSYYAVSKRLWYHQEGDVPWSLEEQNRVLGRFEGFFDPVRLALLDMALIQFDKVFANDAKAASLINLRNAAQKDKRLIAGRTPAELREEFRRFRQDGKVREWLRQKRNKWLAHSDSNHVRLDAPGVREFDRFVEDVQSAFNWLWTAHGGGPICWKPWLDKVEAHTSQAIGILLEELNREQVAKRTAEELSRS